MSDQDKLRKKYASLKDTIERQENSILNKNIYGVMTGVDIVVHHHYDAPPQEDKGNEYLEARKVQLKAEIEAAREKEREAERSERAPGRGRGI